MKTLKEIREARGVKQKAVAEYIGVARQTYCGYENNPRNMSVAQAQAVCDFLRCDVTEVSDIFLNP